MTSPEAPDPQKTPTCTDYVALAAFCFMFPAHTTLSRSKWGSGGGRVRLRPGDNTAGGPKRSVFTGEAEVSLLCPVLH